MSQEKRWALAALSAGGAAAAVAAIAAHQLLQPIVPSSGAPAPWWAGLTIGLGMNLTAIGALAGVYRIVVGYGAKLAGEGRERPLLALGVGVGPWASIFLWLGLEAAL